MQIMSLILRVAEKIVVKMAKEAAYLEANTACPLWTYQIEEPLEVRKMRKF